ncbi:MAG: hypothetical protein HXY26_03480 [Hydrogenophilaceae bacterium]|nr:hypothetical protein [Hydrogenophilaceae bacterium]
MHRLLVLFAALLFALPAHAGQAESENAVTSILFDENMENASYSLRGDGFVDILFGPAVDEKDYIRIVERLRKHPDIPGVLAGRGGKNFCSIP